MALPPPDRNSTALVTGASSGIGREIARGLAARGYGVTLVARRAERLEEVAGELRTAYGTRAEVLPADLASADACEGLVAEIARRGLSVEILVNNAGFGVYERFGDAPIDRELEQLALLIGALVDLSARLLPGMLQRGRGTIINLSSTAAFQALPGNANYAACKAFVLLHSEAVADEVRDRGVTVTAVCPGPVSTEFQATSDPPDRMPKFTWTTPERVAADALRAAERGRRVVIPGGLTKRLFFGFNRRLPTWLTLPFSRRLMEKGNSG